MFNNNIPEYIRFGKNLKSYLDGSILYLTNKYSSDVYKTIHLTTYNITSVEDLDIRGVDDYVVILHKKNSNRYVTFFDPTDIDGTLTTTLIHSYNFSSLGSHVRFSDFDSDVFYYYSKLEYQTRFISTPTYPSGRLENQDLHFPNKDTFWNTTARLFNLYQRKWNSINAIDTSNKFNLLDASTTIANDKMYMIFVNSGRLYALNQKMNDRYFTTIPLDLEKYFRGVHASDSSIGLYFNSAISQILKDTLNLYTNITSSFILQDYATLILKELETFELDYKNLYINGNETFNVIAFQRIMTTIMNIQSKLMPS